MLARSWRQRRGELWRPECFLRHDHQPPELHRSVGQGLGSAGDDVVGGYPTLKLPAFSPFLSEASFGDRRWFQDPNLGNRLAGFLAKEIPPLFP